jgi:hypothetical protein
MIVPVIKRSEPRLEDDAVVLLPEFRPISDSLVGELMILRVRPARPLRIPQRARLPESGASSERSEEASRAELEKAAQQA